MKKIAVILLVVLTTLNSWGQTSEDKNFPVPRAENEFRQLIAFPEGFGLNGPMKVEHYFMFAGPYGPLDLQVTRAGSYDEASTIKNMYLGVSGRILGFNPRDLPNMFHCGPDCTEKRYSTAREKQEILTSLHNKIAKNSNIKLLAQWGQKITYRINSVFVMGNDIREAIPSEKMGFIPSGKWKFYKNIEEYFSKTNIDLKIVQEIIKEMEKHDIRAIKRLGNSGTEISLGGVCDNMFGVLIVDQEGKIPAVNDQTLDGFKYVVVKKLASGIYYYETT